VKEKKNSKFKLHVSQSKVEMTCEELFLLFIFSVVLIACHNFYIICFARGYQQEIICRTAYTTAMKKDGY
jgi:hypothetical protein